MLQYAYGPVRELAFGARGVMPPKCALNAGSITIAIIAARVISDIPDYDNVSAAMNHA